MILRVLDHINAVSPAAWDALLDPAANPFVSWTFLDALEASGCAGPNRGWRPRHLTLWDDDRLAAAAPAYLKADHEGDFARDWIWSNAVERAGVRYYPRLFVTVPVTPVTGRRLLGAPEHRAALLEGARRVAKDERASSAHVLFAHPDELAALEAGGMAIRQDTQAHWFNHGYKDSVDFMARGLDSKQRRNARIERARPAEQGITLRTVRGAELAADRDHWGKVAWGFYHSTIEKLRWGRPWLNRALYERIFHDMPGPLELVVAERGGRAVAGAFNVQHGDRLFGRYWGCTEEHDLLHFNVCLYHSIDDCIARGLTVFEGGAGGEHKLHRGFDLAPTYSGHWFVNSGIHNQIADFLRREREARAGELAKWQDSHPKKTNG